MAQDILVVGVGRPRFGDDALGLKAAEMLRERIGGRARVLAEGGSGAALLPAGPPPDLMVLIDAAEALAGLAPGWWRRLRYPDEAAVLAECGLRDTHTLGVAEILRLAEALGALPGETWIYCMAGERFAPESDLSPVVAASLAAMVRRIEEDVCGWVIGKLEDWEAG